MSEPRLSYWTVQPDRWTFGAKKIRTWVESHLTGSVLNACCGPTRLDHDDVHRNDKNQQITYTTGNGTEHTAVIDPDTQHDVRELADELEETFDVIVYDPPFSDNQAEKTYNIEDGSPVDIEAKESLDALLKPGGRFIQFGYSTSLGEPLADYEMEEIAVWNLLGGQYDWFSFVARKPLEDESQEATTGQTTASETVFQNAGATTHPGGAGDENGGHPIEITYVQLSAEQSLTDRVNSFIESQIAGNTLHLTDAEHGLSLPDDAWQVNLERASPWMLHYDERELSDEFAESFYETVILTPQPKAFQRQKQYEGSSRVEASILKDEVYPLLAADGNVIQVGHTATNIPSRYDCYRAEIGVFAHPNHAYDWVVTRDVKPNGDIRQWTASGGEDGILPSDVPADVRDHAPRAGTQANYSCDGCGESWYRNPVWDVICPDCGAQPNNYCVHDGVVSRSPHSARVAVLFEKHERINGFDATPLADIDQEQKQNADAIAD